MKFPSPHPHPSPICAYILSISRILRNSRISNIYCWIPYTYHGLTATVARISMQRLCSSLNMKTLVITKNSLVRARQYVYNILKQIVRGAFVNVIIAPSNGCYNISFRRCFSTGW